MFKVKVSYLKNPRMRLMLHKTRITNYYSYMGMQMRYEMK